MGGSGRRGAGLAFGSAVLLGWGPLLWVWASDAALVAELDSCRLLGKAHYENDDFELAVEEPPQEDSKQESPKVKEPLQEDTKEESPEPKKKEADPEKDPEDQLLDDFLNDVQ